MMSDIVPTSCITGKVTIKIEKDTEDEAHPSCASAITVYPPTLNKETFFNGSDISVYKMPIFRLNDSEIVSLPDIHKAMQHLYKSSAQVSQQITKLGITTHRFLYPELTRLKIVGTVSPDAKCCSYLMKPDCERLVSRYDQIYKVYRQHLIEWAVPINLHEIKVTNINNSRKSRTKISKLLETASCFPQLHTFLIEDNKVVCTEELDHVLSVQGCKDIKIIYHANKLGIDVYAFDNEQESQIIKALRWSGNEVNGHRFTYIHKDCVVRLLHFYKVVFCRKNEEFQVHWLPTVKISSSSKPKLAFKTVTTSFSGSSFHPLQSSSNRPDLDWSVNNRPQKRCKLSSGIAYPSSSVDEFQRVDENSTHVESPNACSDGNSHLSESEAETTVDHDISRKGKENVLVKIKEENIDEEEEEKEEEEEEEEEEELVIENSETESFIGAEVEESDCPCRIQTFSIGSENVVCLPDVHRAVKRFHGQSVQVGYYLFKLLIPTYKFTNSQIKLLKSHRIIRTNATVCSYITQQDTERLLKMYESLYDDDATGLWSKIEWLAPVPLPTNQCGFDTSHDDIQNMSTLGEDAFSEHSDVVPLQINAFVIGGEVIVCLPDVHKAVQFLNGSSVQVDYNLRKLGITKRRYSHSQLLKMKVMNIVKRPSLCTFITQLETMMLLKFYADPNCLSKLKYISFLPPVNLDGSELTPPAPKCTETAQNHSDHPSPVPESSTYPGTENKGENEYSISDLYKVFIGSEMDSSSVDTDKTQLHILQSPSGSTPSPTSASIVTSHLHVPGYCATHGIAPAYAMQYDADGCYALPQQVYAPCACGNHAPIFPTQVPMQAACVVSPVSSESSETGKESTQSTQAQTDSGDFPGTLEHREDVEMKLRKVQDENKKLKLQVEEFRQDLKRKETELKLLHDAYHQEILQEKKKREIIEKELETLKGKTPVEETV